MYDQAIKGQYLFIILIKNGAKSDQIQRLCEKNVAELMAKTGLNVSLLCQIR